MSMSRGWSNKTVALLVGGILCACLLWINRQELGERLSGMFAAGEDDPVLWSSKEDLHIVGRLGDHVGRDVVRYKSGRTTWHKLPAGEWAEDEWPAVESIKPKEKPDGS